MLRQLRIAATLAAFAGLLSIERVRAAAGRTGRPWRARRRTRRAGRGLARGGADGTVTLRLLAPNAKQITVNGELDGKPHPMTKGENGIWTVTIGPLPPDIYTYAFNVDGVTALDPRNTNTKMGYGGFGPVSVVQVPGDGPQFYDVEAGAARRRCASSRTCRRRSASPHGLGLHAARLRQGQELSGAVPAARRRRHRVRLDDDRPRQQHPRQPDRRGQGQADGRGDAARPRHSELLCRARRSAAAPATQSGRRRRRGAGAGALSPFAKDLLEDVMPMVEKTYKVSKKADDRAIAGLSMGGGQTINIALQPAGALSLRRADEPRRRPATSDQAYPRRS